MAHILLVEDNADQLLLRRLILERAGHTVTPAATAAEARLALEPAPDVAVMDLSLPGIEDGLALVRDVSAACPSTKIAILSGWTAALEGRPEKALVAATITKPSTAKHLMDIIAKLALCLLLILPAWGREFAFESTGRGETVAELDLRSNASDWGIARRQAAVAKVSVDGGDPQHVWVLGERKGPVSVFLGQLPAGKHRLSIERDETFSAPDSTLDVRGAKFSEDSGAILANAPVLYAREDTMGKFSDIPLLVYAERLPGGILQYTIVFSNEDGGTSTRGLMAVWGRTTDIEYIYRVGTDGKAIIQAKDHKDIPYDGPLEGHHPLLVPVTKNNMVAPTTTEKSKTAMRFQLVPMEVELSTHSREIVMDRAPWTYAVAAKELTREGRLDQIGDPRNYLYLEASITSVKARLGFKVRLVTETAWRMSHRDDRRLAIERSGWVRSTIALPAGTSPKQIAEFGYDCLPNEKDGVKDPGAACKIEQISPAFFLTPDYLPGRPFKLPPTVIPAPPAPPRKP
ncbi:MAG: response regulator [Acidobacteria bacterium]|nr:response regulator [Acidobacteriota bacterium]